MCQGSEITLPKYYKEALKKCWFELRQRHNLTVEKTGDKKPVKPDPVN